MTQGFIVIHPSDPLQSQVLLLPSNKSLEAHSPFKGWLHVLCVLRDTGDSPYDRLNELLARYHQEGLTALPDSYRPIWQEYLQWSKNPDKPKPVYRAPKQLKERSDKRAQPGLKDPDWCTMKVCSRCNRPIRLKLWESKHELLCTAKPIPPKMTIRILKSMGVDPDLLQTTSDVQITRGRKPSSNP